MKIHEKIFYLRKKAGLSQEELADKLDVSRQAIYKWETEASTPEVNKIKELAKLFNVSFDYLMNDEIHELEEEKPVFKPLIRRAFVTEEKRASNQADLDNGYLPERKKLFKNSTHLADQKAAAERAMKDVGATEIIFLQRATAFFYAAKNCVIGFYYAGAVQFVCPLENVVQLDFSNGNDFSISTRKTMPMVGFGANGLSVGATRYNAMSTMPDTIVTVVLTYQENGSFKEFTMDLNAAEHVYSLDGMGIDIMVDLWRRGVKSIMDELKRVQVRLQALKKIVEKIKAGEIIVKPVENNAYKAKNIRTKSAYNTYLYELQQEMENDRKKGIIKTVIIIAAIALVALLFFMELSKV